MTDNDQTLPSWFRESPKTMRMLEKERKKVAAEEAKYEKKARKK